MLVRHTNSSPPWASRIRIFTRLEIYDTKILTQVWILEKWWIWVSLRCITFSWHLCPKSSYTWITLWLWRQSMPQRLFGVGQSHWIMVLLPNTGNGSSMFLGLLCKGMSALIRSGLCMPFYSENCYTGSKGGDSNKLSTAWPKTVIPLVNKSWWKEHLPKYQGWFIDPNNASAVLQTGRHQWESLVTPVAFHCFQ